MILLLFFYQFDAILCITVMCFNLSTYFWKIGVVCNYWIATVTSQSILLHCENSMKSDKIWNYPNRERMIFNRYEVSTDQKFLIICFFLPFFPVEFGSGLLFLWMFAHLWEPGRAAILATSSGVRENWSATRGSTKQSTRAVYWTIQNRNVYFLPTNWSWTLSPDQQSQQHSIWFDDPLPYHYQKQKKYQTVISNSF